MVAFRYRRVKLSSGRTFLINCENGIPFEIPEYFATFLNYVFGKYLIHRHQCEVSKLSYLRSDYIKLLYRSGPFQNYVLQQIRKLNEMIADQWDDTVPNVFVIDLTDVAELRLLSGEVLFDSCDSYFSRLLFSCLQCY